MSWRAVQSRDSIRMARTRKESNKACAPEHASTTQSHSFRTARNPELTVTTGIALRLMVLLAVTTGLRRSELFALKWSDLDFSNLTIDIQRSIYQGKVGSCKTAASKTSIPLPLFVAADL